MTTSILAQKLLSVKLDKSEFEKIKWLRYRNTENQHKIIRTLDKIIQKQIANKTCRLCLRPGGINIFGNTQDYIANNIKNVLGIEILEDDGKPQHICNSCDTTIKNTVELKQTAETTQWRLQQELDLVTTPLDWDPAVTEGQHNSYFVQRDMKIVREWKCRKCKRIFQSQKQYDDHNHLRIGGCKKIRGFILCETCGLKFKNVTRLNKHRLTHTGDLHFACTHCAYRARTKYALVAHERSHTGHKPLTCPYCSATFRCSSNLASHKKKHLPPAYHCHLCQKGLKFKQALQNHMASQHSNVKPFSCILCDKTFSTSKTLRRHERMVHNRPIMKPGALPNYLKQQINIS